MQCDGSSDGLAEGQCDCDTSCSGWRFDAAGVHSLLACSSATLVLFYWCVPAGIVRTIVISNTGEHWL